MRKASRSINVSAAQKLLDELRATYIRDLPAQLDELEQLVLAMNNPAEAESNFDDLYRRVHSLKGTAGTYGLQIISAICHQFEDYLSECQQQAKDGSEQFMESGLQYVDLLRQTHELIYDGMTKFPEIESALSEIKAHVTQKEFSGMVIECSKTSSDLALRLLAETPIHFTLVQDGVTALDRLMHEPFDILLTGMEIPRLNGAALISALRLSKGLNSHIKTVLVTAGDIPELPPLIRPDRILHRDASYMQKLMETTQEFVDQLRAESKAEAS